MKKLIREMFFGDDSRISAAIAFCVIASIGLGCFCKKDGFDFSNLNTSTSNTNTKTSPILPTNTEGNTPSSSTPKVLTSKADASKGEKPSEEEMNQIVEQTLLDFNQAIQDEDFTNFRAKVSKPFRDQYTADGFKQAFETFIAQKKPMGSVLSSITDLKPEYTSGPEVVKESGTKVLKATGTYQTFPGMKFDLAYIPEKTDWKLLKIEIRVGME